MLLCAKLLPLQITECKCNLFHQTEQIAHVVPELQVREHYLFVFGVLQTVGHLVALGKLLLISHWAWVSRRGGCLTLKGYRLNPSAFAFPEREYFCLK